MKHRLLLLYCWLIRSSLYFLPDMHIFMRFRGWLYGLGLNTVGKNFQVAHNVILSCIERLSVGDNVYIAPYGILYATGKIIIKNNVIIGPNCLMSSGNHTFHNDSYCNGPGIFKQINIESGCWIAGHCILLAGSSLPARSVLAAGSVLTRNVFFEEGIYGGVPARLIRTGHLESNEEQKKKI